MRLTTITLTVLAAATFAAAVKADDTPKRSPELQVLERWVGAWDHQVTTKSADGEATTVETVDYRFWSRGGRILHISNPTDEQEFHMSLTYDSESKTYPGVMLIGSYRAVVTGTWEAKTQTMAFVIKDADGGTYRGTHRFIRDDRAESNGVLKNFRGEIVFEHGSKQARSKESAKADETSKRSPELQVLDRFIGAWEHEVTIQPAEGDAITSKPVDYKFWSRGGRILHFSNPTDEAEFHMSLTYDSESKTYPGVMLIGSAKHFVTGTWEAKTQTMTYVMEHSDGGTYRGTTRFIGKDRSESNGVVKNAEGEIVFERKATAKRTPAETAE
jgi:hypothetical protein